jgi:hypothetical protein
MTAAMTITSVAELDAFSESVHDWWVDLDTVKWDEAASVLEFAVLRPIRRNRRSFDLARIRAGDAVMVQIRGARQVVLEDTQEIGQYTVRDIVFDPLAKTLTIESGIPMKLSAVVDRLEVAVIPVGDAP